MKKGILSVIFILSAALVFAQAPKAINYQGLARDASDAVLANKSIGLRISILSGSPSGSSVYTETFSAATNKFGLFSIQIGTGSAVSGNFSSINWASGNYYIKTEIDPSGGTSYTVLGTSQLVSVPYAFYADKSGSGGNGTSYYAGKGISISNDSIINTVSQKIYKPGTGIKISNDSIINTVQQKNYKPGAGIKISNDSIINTVSQKIYKPGAGIKISNDSVINTLKGTQWGNYGSAIYYKSGKVGIGVTNPQYEFVVADTANYNKNVIGYMYSNGSTSSSGVSTTLFLTNTGTDGVNRGLESHADATSSGTNEGVFGSAHGGDLGNIGVLGTATTPSTNGENYGLEGLADSSSKANAGVVGSTDGVTSLNVGVFGTSYGSASSGTNIGVYGVASSGGTNMAGYFNGDLLYTGTLSKASDANLKSDIQPIASVLPLLKNITPVTYYFKNIPGLNVPTTLQYGFTAQNMEQTFPSLVINRTVPVSTTEKNKLGTTMTFKTVDYLDMVPILTQAVKEQQQVIESQAQQIRNLNNQLEIINQRLKAAGIK